MHQLSYMNNTKQDIMPDEETIAAVTVNKKMLENGEDINIEDAAETPKTSHSEGLGAVKTALQYFDQQGVSIMDLLT
ncbi:uncharacterized protein TNCV_2561151 [Trichonephila clavipes]|uniref:Uncharacterized protein n=1 Tax=Trichonephila clavipes TaxID=2585209 RepID=A0A8X6USQ1_TRICX|nr:uncharacterized protein TNCV_2561151 [Trichonephila clavipes]